MGSANPILFGGGPSNQSVYEVVTTARHTPGTRGQLYDGRTFEYVRSDQGTAIGKGKLATYEAMAAASDQVVCQAAVAIGATSVPVTVTLTLTLNELAGGFLSVNDDAGEAELYGILGHAAHSAGTLTLNIDREVVVAMTTNTTSSIVHGSTSVKISAAVTSTADPVEAAAGVPLVEIPIGSTTPQFAWVQKTGMATVLCGAVVGTVGQAVYQGAVAGAFQQATLDIDTTVNIPSLVQLGTAIDLVGISGEYFAVRLSIT